MEENESKEEVVKKEEQQAEIETSENAEKIEKQDETNQQKEETKQNEEVEDTENGIEISNDVIAVIAGVAVSEVQGVASMAGGFAGGISEVFSGKKNMSKGIKVDKTENKAKIDVNIIVEYGSRIPDVAYEIQNRVKKSVEGMTGFKVEEVNVHVQMKTKIKKLRKKPIKLACERNGIKNEIYRKTYTNNIFKYNINIINNSMFINLWMVGHKCSTKFS